MKSPTENKEENKEKGFASQNRDYSSLFIQTKSKMPNSSKKPKISGATVLLDADHSGRDEMNLAGNPFASLQASAKTGQTFLHREWKRTLANGREVQASWHVDGDSELGLPGPTEELLYLILLQLTREQKEEDGEWPQTINFSRHEIMERLGWSGNARDYRLLKERFQG